MKHDKGLLKAAKLQAFRQWLTASGFECRDGKGDFEVLQVKVGPKLWAVVNSSAAGVLTSHPELRPLINRFNQGGAPLTVQAAPAPAAKRDTFLDDLRDDIAMRVLPSLLIDAYHTRGSTPEAMAESAYDIADAMLAERAKRLGRGARA